LDKQQSLADESGLAVVVIEGKESFVVTSANNNSICKTLQKSAKFAPLCQSFCGEANKHIKESGKKVCMKCHAGLTYMAVPVGEGEKGQTSTILGRTFLKTEDYFEATNRAENGNWKEFDSAELFENVLWSSSLKSVEDLAEKIENLSDDEKTELLFLEKKVEEIVETEALNKLVEEFKQKEEVPIQTVEISENLHHKELEELATWRSLFGSLLELNYKQAAISILQFLAKCYEINSLAWLKPKGNRLELLLASGNFKGTHMKFSLAIDDKRLFEAFYNETSLELKQKANTETDEIKRLQLFPLVVGSNVRSALVVGDKLTEENKHHISKFCKQLASQIEILQLREELEKQARISIILQKLNDNLDKIDSADFWDFIIRTTADLLQAERGSILVYDKENKEFTVQSALGNNPELVLPTKQIGEKIALKVLQKGKPLLVKDLQEIGIPPATANFKYKSNSFICYPILIGERKIGVLCFTDKAENGTFDENDLQILETIAPQIAVAIDRVLLKLRANEYEQLSMTDQLTNLPNRRYLEERLSEEIKRFQRYGNPTSFMMIDVDKFKSYNDNFGHLEGDKALQLVGQCLKNALRGADVAARYGGEEFSILLPQTSLDEAMVIAERIRQKVENTTFPNRQVTISIGVSALTNSINTAHKLISTADETLFVAKEKGRNNVQKFGE
jgi:diguanylate cyclase (GGDEF)-like protein